MVRIRTINNGTEGGMSKSDSHQKGLVLFIVIIFACFLTIIAFATLSLASGEIILAQQSIKKAQAFYAAEAALAKFSANTGLGKFVSIDKETLGNATYKLDYYPDESPPYAIATGISGGEQKRIKVRVRFLAPPYECSAYAGNRDGAKWNFILRGTGSPKSTGSGNYGGKDIVNGNVFANGDVHMFEESIVNPPLAPNPFGLNGDVESTGTIDTYDSATISGAQTEGVPPYSYPDLVGMNYSINNTHNVSKIFADEGVTHGPLPAGNELRDVFQINPSNMVGECATTPGDDYFLTTTGGFVEGNWKTAKTYLDAGEDRIYYIDGDLWVHNKSTYGFNIDGKVTIVVTGNIHLSDNLEYYDSDTMLGLVALGKYDENGNLVSGGNIYFGDPVYGTLYQAAGMMFAANDFLYNTDPISATSAEPGSGFIINGSLIALNQVKIERDWYTESTTGSGYFKVDIRKPCYYDPKSGKWFDTISKGALTLEQEATIKHYQMVLNYDDRVRSPETQPLGLPRGEGTIYEGLCNWQELAPDE